MGLYGALIVRPSAGADFAYNSPATAFDPAREFLLLLNEIDPDLHHAVETGGTLRRQRPAQPVLRDQRAGVPGHRAGQRLRAAAEPAVRRAGADPAEHRHEHPAGPDPDDQRRHCSTTRSTRTATTPRQIAQDGAAGRRQRALRRDDRLRADRGLPAALGRPGQLEPGTNPLPVRAAQLPEPHLQGRQHLVQRQPVPRLQGHAADRDRDARTSAASGTSRCTATRSTSSRTSTRASAAWARCCGSTRPAAASASPRRARSSAARSRAAASPRWPSTTAPTTR